MKVRRQHEIVGELDNFSSGIDRRAGHLRRPRAYPPMGQTPLFDEFAHRGCTIARLEHRHTWTMQQDHVEFVPTQTFLRPIESRPEGVSIEALLGGLCIAAHTQFQKVSSVASLGPLAALWAGRVKMPDDACPWGLNVSPSFRSDGFRCRVKRNRYLRRFFSRAKLHNFAFSIVLRPSLLNASSAPLRAPQRVQ